MITLQELLVGTGGQVMQPGPAAWSGFSYDSRRTQAGELFVALSTTTGDGHDHVLDAIAAGATGVLCHRAVQAPTGVGIIQVSDTSQALLAYARHLLRARALVVAAITGSAGKSTTKELLAAMLSQSSAVFRPPESYNGRLGLPIALGALLPAHSLAVLELAADSLGEIAELAALVRPQVAIVTHVGDSHLAAFGSQQVIAREKAALLAHLQPGGVAVLNADDPLVRAMETAPGVRRVLVGCSPDAEFRIDSYAATWSGVRLLLQAEGRALTLTTRLLGAHQAQLLALAAAAARAMGASWEAIAAAAADYTPLPGRLAPLAGVHGCRLVDDSYNASPTAVRAALDTVAALPAQRRTLVLGDMADLGAAAQALHEEAGRLAAASVDRLITLGDLAAHAGLAARQAGLSPSQVTICHAQSDAISAVRQGLSEGDVVLVKGSAASRMEEVVRALMAEPAQAPQRLARQHPAFELAHTAMPDRPAWLEIDMEAIAGNVRAMQAVVGPRVGLMAVLKADAYGHGAVRVGRTAINNGAAWLAVASLNEALPLRDAGIDAPILILGYLPPWQARVAVLRDIAVALYDLRVARALSAAAQDVGRPAVAHLKIETGMGRLGVQPEEAVAFAGQALAMPGLTLDGVFSHLATADEADLAYALWQIDRFDESLAALAEAGIAPRWVHLANSAAAIRLPSSRYNLVRPGIALYGLAPSVAAPLPAGMRPALAFKCQVAQVRSISPGSAVGYGRAYVADAPRRVAVIPVGYADGFRRGPRNWGEVLVRGRRAPIVGQVCMDQTMVDVTAVPNVRAGDEVVLIGRQGSEAITVEDVAARLGTIGYEVVAAILARVPRVT